MNVTDEMVKRAATAACDREYRTPEALARLMLTAALGEVEPLEGVLLAHLVDDTMPGKDIRIGHNDGEWHVSQEHCGLEESWPTGIVGTGPTIDAAIRDAIANALEQAK